MLSDPVSLYQKSEKIHPREVSGRFQRLRVLAVYALLGLYYILPWVQWDGRQAVLFDLPERQFYIFGMVFWPQDLYLLSALLILAALALFFFTALAGRLWCGYACPQTVWTEVFVWMEQWTEGPRQKRIKLDQAPWGAEKLLRKGAKQVLWIGFALLTGFTFVAYFSSAPDLFGRLLSLELGSWEAFWIFLFGLATYGNAGFLREQLCIYMCPYARFQGAMFDPDTLIISYDEQRGEPRGKRKRSADRQTLGLGDCVDCHMCVQVCPTGIDIRDGLQYECIGCGLCIDACNGVMDKLKRPRNLIGYYTGNQLEGRPEPRRRPRLVGYASAFGIMLLVLGFVFVTRGSIELDVQRDRSALYTDVFTSDGPMRENSYLLSVQNKRSEAVSLELSASGEGRLEWFGEQVLDLAAGERRQIPVRLRSAPAGAPVRRIAFEAHETGHDSATLARRESSFFSSPPGPG